MAAQKGDGIPISLPQEIVLSDSRVFRLKDAITDYRGCHVGSPKEARILFLCQQDGSEGLEAIVKVKLQLPDNDTKLVARPSTTTATELTALELFRENNTTFVPQLIAFEQRVQDAHGPLPGGYINYTFMTKMPGQNLLDYKYWSASFDERAVIQQKFIIALKYVIW